MPKAKNALFRQLSEEEKTDSKNRFINCKHLRKGVEHGVWLILLQGVAQPSKDQHTHAHRHAQEQKLSVNILVTMIGTISTANLDTMVQKLIAILISIRQRRKF